jgi:CRP-like cAMP-binding protein
MLEFLSSHHLLAGLAHEDVDVVSSGARDRVFAPGQVILLEGHVAGTLHLVRRGNVALAVRQARGESVTVEVLTTGAVLGGEWIVAPYRWNCDAHAIDEVETVAIDATSLRTKALADTLFGVALLSRVALGVLRQLEDTRRRLPPVPEVGRDDV